MNKEKMSVIAILFAVFLAVESYVLYADDESPAVEEPYVAFPVQEILPGSECQVLLRAGSEQRLVWGYLESYRDGDRCVVDADGLAVSGNKPGKNKVQM